MSRHRYGPAHRAPRRRAYEYGPAVRSHGAAALAAARRAGVAAVSGLMLWSVAPVGLGWHSTVVVSGSMAPGIRVGDVVAAAPVAPADAGRLRPGSVVLVDDPASPGRLLLHRLVRYGADGAMITKGDANPAPDTTPVPTGNLRGQARLRVPLIGLPMVWMRDGQYTPLAAVAALLIVMLFWRPGADRDPDSDGGPEPVAG